jgi:hypothetical protein
MYKILTVWERDQPFPPDGVILGVWEEVIHHGVPAFPDQDLHLQHQQELLTTV